MGWRLVSLRHVRLHSKTLFESARRLPRLATYDSQVSLVCNGQAYRGDDRLDYQLTAQFKLWLRDETKGLTIDESKKPMLSRIFLWYAGDFETRGGSPAYAAQYAPAGAARDALATTSPDYFAYDWNLNTQ